MRLVIPERPPVLAGRAVLTAAGDGVETLVDDPPRRPRAGAAVPVDLAAIGRDWDAVLRRADRYGALGFAAALLALRDAGTPPPGALDPGFGVAFGSSLACLGSIHLHRRALEGEGDAGPALFLRTAPNAANGDVSIAWRLGGPSETFVSGWTAGAEALAAAAVALGRGRADRMLAVGVEAPEGPARAAYAAARGRPGGAWLPESLAEGAAAVLLRTDGPDGAPRLLAWGRARDPEGEEGIGAALRALAPRPVDAVLIANSLPGPLRDRIGRQADGRPIVDLAARAGEIGAAGAVACAALAPRVSPAGALIVARDPAGETAVLLVGRGSG